MVLLDAEPGSEPRAHRLLPPARGPISSDVLSLLASGPPGGDPATSEREVADRRALLGSTTAAAGEMPSAPAEVLRIITDDDLQLALHVIYELSYRGFDGVDDRSERDPRITTLRCALEDRFESAVRRRVDQLGLIDRADSVHDVIARFAGPSLSEHMAERGTVEQFREFAVHRSAYQLKEADPHSWAIPRLSGPRKAALVEIQADEYGNGRPGEAHADLFADVLAGLGLDTGYGAYVDRLPGSTLATGNLISLLGLQQRLRGALLGHLAAFELTSVTPMTRYAAAAVRFGLPDEVLRFYTVHIEADEHHGTLAAEVMVGGDPTVDDLSLEEICFGAAALLVVEDQFARRLLRAWGQEESSLLGEPV